MLGKCSKVFFRTLGIPFSKNNDCIDLSLTFVNCQLQYIPQKYKRVFFSRIFVRFAWIVLGALTLKTFSTLGPNTADLKSLITRC